MQPRFCFAFVFAALLAGQPSDATRSLSIDPVRAVTDPGVITTRQSITPAGVPSVFGGRVYGADFGADANRIWVLHATHVFQLDWRANRVISKVAHGGTPGLQGLRFDPASGQAFISGTGKDRKTRLAAVSGEGLRVLWEGHGTQIAGGLAVAAGKRVAAPLIFDNKLVVSDSGGAEARGISTEIAPFAAVMNAAGTVAWVSHWGGRRPREKDVTAPTGLASSADRVVVDSRGIAASGTVMRVDLAYQKLQ
ncbi:MAG: hypothetical protein U0Q16_19630 [Bryobacteraceae bacterium]